MNVDDESSTRQRGQRAQLVGEVDRIRQQRNEIDTWMI